MNIIGLIPFKIYIVKEVKTNVWQYNHDGAEVSGLSVEKARGYLDESCKRRYAGL